MYLEKQVLTIYNDTSQWKESKTMEHASGIWGRVPTLSLLRDSVILSGDVVVDLGCGAGYVSSQMTSMVGPQGRVIGVEGSDAMLTTANRLLADSPGVTNLEFRQGDITRNVPVPANTADVVTSFMVCHNLRQNDLRAMFAETERILKPHGTGVFLTMHHEALESDWDLDFMKYDTVALRAYREAADKEDVCVPGLVKNAGGGTKEVIMFHHTRENMIGAIRDAGLMFINELDLWIDRATAIAKFGAGAVRGLPGTPTFWIIVIKK